MRAQSRGRSRLAVRAGVIVATGLLLSGCGALSLFKSHKEEPGASEPYPNLSSVPGRPEEKESAADRRKIAEGLVADRTQVQYTDQALRGGTEASAPPPPPPVAEMPESAATESTGATQATKGETEEEEPGFFGRLLGSKKSKESNAAKPAPPAEQAAAPTSAPPSAEAPQNAPVESTDKAGSGKEQGGEGKSGFFHRLFGSKKDKGSSASGSEITPAPSQAEAQPAAETSSAAPSGEATGATEFGKDQSGKSKAGIFHRLFGSKKNKEATEPSHDAQSASPEPTAAPSSSPAAAQ